MSSGSKTRADQRVETTIFVEVEHSESPPIVEVEIGVEESSSSHTPLSPQLPLSKGLPKAPMHLFHHPIEEHKQKVRADRDNSSNKRNMSVDDYLGSSTEFSSKRPTKPLQLVTYSTTSTISQFSRPRYEYGPQSR
ncbi:hypothetical protein HAX54_045797 [Datura stramonium]|uniref:Uncharacterized protein n=1 Tax=Datura stramonium TaxID=4076 RepID=A0ABS8WI10_DATST|nr:hypothetical protein [Datura stramonium]